MDDCFDRLMFKNRPGIQTASSIFFTVNSILVMVFLFSVLMAEDAAVQLKLSSIDSNPAEIQFAGSLVVSSFYISSLMDLYLIIGIEDNSRVPMLAYMWWSSFTTMAHALALIAIAIWKSNKENVALIGPFVGTAGLFVLLKAYFTRKVYRYSMLVLNPDFVAAEVAEMSAAAAAAERLSQPPPTFAPHRDSAEYVQLNKFG
ncbi:uncharacterized protein LOC119382513 isoform X1 [Rhipicephalus sanguineus]|uniref:uncharacterized protein LOC119382513 isoform X1 n=2 Tax=Rhipicephalus sanguineus TaxID=34632 RepID=UPI0018948AFB|nr:uncharacterized protein LOC119382513 isoform X1 [Rhipicephalus sanguineus]XP_037506155.1 uncharacterized protein LOC119382513 isoform X1 [Rhipicephalus sanguineus]